MAAKKNVLVFTTWSYKDGLIQAATIPYLKILQPIIQGEIYLVCWEQPGLALSEAEYLEEQKKLDEFHIKLLRIPYHKNKLLAAVGWGAKLVSILFTCYARRISFFHAFSTPAGSLAYIASKFRRVRLTVDSMEPHADLMAETGVWPPGSWLYRLAFFMEKKLVRRADALIAISKSIRPYFIGRYGIDPPPGKLYYRPLCVSTTLFRPMPPDYSLLGWEGKRASVIGIYTGKLGGMYYDDEFCAFIISCIRHWEGDFHLILCTAMPLAETTEYLIKNGVEAKYFTITFVPHTQIPAFLALADFGISFSRPSPARQYGCPTKNAEYWAAGLPVVATDAILDDNYEISQNPFLGIVLTEKDLENPEPQLHILDQQMAPGGMNKEKLHEYAMQMRSFEQVRQVYHKIYA